VTLRWEGSKPLWPALPTGVTDIRMATGEAPVDGEHRDWYERHDPVLRLARALAGAGPEAVRRVHAQDAAARERIEAAVDFAVRSPLPAPQTALDHVVA
jgi:hypothetical protein